MAKYNLYIYYEGGGLTQETVEKQLLEYLQRDLIEKTEKIKVINDKPENYRPDKDGFWPDWNIGINVRKEDVDNDNIDLLVSLFQKYADENNWEFACGFYDDETKISEDLIFIEPKNKKHPHYLFQKVMNFLFYRDRKPVDLLLKEVFIKKS